jgi:alpha-L-rhamnosidase
VQANKDAKLAARTANALRLRLYDPAAGAMRINEADPSGDHTQDANVAAVLAGVLKGPSAAAALRFIYNHLMGPFGPATAENDSDPYMARYISPWISGWELIARFELGDTGTALDEIRREWGQMLAVDPHTTLWEKMTVGGGVAPYQGANPDGTPIVEKADVVPGSGETSLAHGWSAGPTYALSAYVLGLRPVDPGFATWIVQPQLGNLRVAQGQVLTRHGPLASRWQVSDRRSFKLTVRVPTGTSGTVGVPMLGSTKRTVARDGVVIWKGGKPEPGVDAKIAGDYLMIAEDRRGTHTYAWGK